MSDKRFPLAAALIRNFNEVPPSRMQRAPHYDFTQRVCILAPGLLAQKLGASFRQFLGARESEYCP